MNYLYLSEKSRLKSALESMCHQFAYETVKNDVPCLTTGGLSALGEAFDVLGWEDPYPVPSRKCEIEGCPEHATCGSPTKNGYKRLCSKHYSIVGVED